MQTTFTHLEQNDSGKIKSLKKGVLQLNLLMLVGLFSITHLNAQIQIGDDIDGARIMDKSGTAISLNAKGNIVAIGSSGHDGSVVAIGSIGHDNGKGHVRVYRNMNGSWTQIGADIDGSAPKRKRIYCGHWGSWS